ncbi:coenzyme A transporter [Coemansia sp. RSA 2320]|nr:coenzyme A transporter [Coemansia sp. RSA 2320]
MAPGAVAAPADSSITGSANEPGYASNAASWGFTGAMLSVPRSSAVATSVGHFAFFAGGRLQNGTDSDVIDIFNRRTNQWAVARLSVSRSGIGAGSLANRYALFAGGFDSSFRPLSVVDVYDTETSKWSTITLNTPRAYPRFLDLGSTTAIVGGLSGDLQYLSRSVDYVGADLHVTNDTMQVQYPQFGLAVADERCGVGLYTSGYQNNKPGERFNDFEASNQTHVFVAGTPAASFSSAPEFPYPRWGAGGAAANGVFAVGGGHIFGDGTTEPLTTVVDRVDLYRTSTGQWSSSPLKLSVPRDYPLVQAVGDYIVFAAGTEASKDFDILDTRTGSFIDSLQHHPALYTLRTDAAATTVDNCLLIIAGGLSVLVLITMHTAAQQQQQQPESAGITAACDAHLALDAASGPESAAVVENAEPVLLPTGTTTLAGDNTKYAIKTLVIGGIAGCTAKTVVAPLDRVKILFQTHNARFVKYTGTHFGLFRASAAIYREYGVRGLFQGHSMQLARIFPYAAIKFMSYEQLKMVLGKHVGDQHVRNFLAGSLCGVISVAVSYPLDMIRVRMAYLTPASGVPAERVFSVARMIYSEPAYRFGLFNFFRGFPLSLMGIIPYGGVSFLTHEYFTSLARSRFAHVAARPIDGQNSRGRRRKQRELRGWAELAAGGLSGIFAQTASYPFELVRRRMQIAGAHDPARKASAIKVVREVWNTGGVRGFFVGLTIGYVKVVPMFAASFYTYEKLKVLFDLE